VTLREIVQLMQEICPEAYLLVDETYREAAYTDDPIAESALALGPKVISVASLSKCRLGDHPRCRSEPAARGRQI
jgi:hypothetical protein